MVKHPDTWVSLNFPLMNRKWGELVQMMINSSVMDRIEPCSGIWADKEQLEFVSVMSYLSQYQFEVKYVEGLNDKLAIQIEELKQELQEASDMLFAVAPVPY